jgi:diguanylate cyclase (GGDEF)-like protein
VSDLFVSDEVAEATRTLARLKDQANVLRAELATLRQNLADARRGSGAIQNVELKEANQQLVLAALQAETTAEIAVADLGDLTRASQRDTLTDTPNRVLMLDRLENAIVMARRHGARIAVLFLDVDRFKPINDTLGHAAGDEVLQIIARRLESVVRDSDTVSRHGGDEFLVLLSEVLQPSDAALVASKIIAALAAPARVGDDDLRLSASIGIAIYPGDGEDAASLIDRADAAMYRCKRLGRGRFEFHREETVGDRALEQRHAATLGEAASGEQQPHFRVLREANEQLVMAAMTAQELEARAEEAHLRQLKFLAMLAHELRNPLPPVGSAAKLLKHVQADEPLLARLQVIIKRQLTHMSTLVDEVREDSRASAAKIRLECSTVDMADILRVAAATSAAATDLRLQHVTLQPPPSPLTVYGDPVRLAYVFSILLENASKRTATGGEIVLTVEAHARAVEIRVSNSENCVAAQPSADMFDLLPQDMRAIMHPDGAVGVGLAVVRDLVEAHGGTVVGRRSDTDLGSDFVVTLPILDTLSSAART